MKTLLTIFLSLVVLSSGMAQTVRRVNNNTGISASAPMVIYTTLQAAHDASVANDILIIEPSVISYGDLTLTKPLKIYGNGYFLDINVELKADKRTSTVGYIYFNTGSGGSEVYGLYTLSSFIVHGVSNIKIARCNISYGIQISNSNKAGTTNTNVTNILVNQNIVINNGGSGAVFSSPTASYTISNVLIGNNLFGSPLNASSDPSVQNWVIKNNTFYNNVGVSLVNSVFENNFFVSGGSVSFSNVTYSYNISTGATFANLNIGNRNNYPLTDPETSVSQLVGTGTGISPDEQYQIKTGAELKTLGNSSTEVGAYGGSTPYIVSGIPAIPSIVNMINSGSGDNSNPLKVTISVKSNN